MEITFLTGNSGKLKDAQTFFDGSDIILKHQSFDIPEIQSSTAEEVVSFSANYAKEKFDEAFFVLDRSFHIEGLNGFPGPFVKYINKWLTSELILKMMEVNHNRKAYWTTSIACHVPGREIKIFSGNIYGTITLMSSGMNGYMMDRIFIPYGQTKSIADMDPSVSTKMWNDCSCWKELLNYLSKNN